MKKLEGTTSVEIGPWQWDDEGRSLLVGGAEDLVTVFPRTLPEIAGAAFDVLQAACIAMENDDREGLDEAARQWRVLLNAARLITEVPE